MPIFASNFTSNSLSGAVFVSGGNVAVTLTPVPYALEGDKSFVIKIRRGSIQGTVVSTSAPITLKDRSSFVSLTANTATVLEGNLVSFTVTTANTVDGATLYYSVFPVTANVTAEDFTANIGSVVIANNTATFALKANADLSLMDETGENFRVQLRTNSTTGNVVYTTTSNIAITDYSRGYGYISFTSPSANYFEGDTIRFQVQTYNAANTLLFYSTTGGNAAASNFIANTGSFTVGADNFANITLVANTNLAENDTRTFQLQIRIGSVDGAIGTTSNIITIKDSNLQPPAIELLLVAGGGGTQGDSGGGGGAGGLLYYGTNATPKTPNGNVYQTTVGTYTITVGAGGQASDAGTLAGATGSNTSISFGGSAIYTAFGGGAGGMQGIVSPYSQWIGSGGSGGGGGYGTGPEAPGIVYGANGIAGQGNSGGNSKWGGGNPGTGYGGGGGAGGSGSNGVGGADAVGGAGGNGLSYDITGSALYYAGGGGASRSGAGGLGGGGPAVFNVAAPNRNGGINLGGGAGSAYYGGSIGGSGIAILRYPTAKGEASATTGNPNVIVSGGFRSYRFWQSGTITFS